MHFTPLIADSSLQYFRNYLSWCDALYQCSIFFSGTLLLNLFIIMHCSLIGYIPERDLILATYIFFS